MWSERPAGNPISLFSTLLASALYFLMVYSLQHTHSRAMSMRGHSNATSMQCCANLKQDASVWALLLSLCKALGLHLLQGLTSNRLVARPELQLLIIGTPENLYHTHCRKTHQQHSK